MKIRPQRYIREIPQRYRLEAARTDNNDIYFPPRVVYPGKASAQPIRLSLTGMVLSWTRVYVAASEYHDQAPYFLALVKLDGVGGQLLAQLVDVEPDEVKTGMKVRLEFRKIRQEGEEGIICYGYKAVPDW
ncbi:MAG: Zn-ribbon domain-containing OB-fold protein [bacterium]